MKFVDEATIEVRAGHGGSGALSFRREKYVPYGGPDGGNGGRGGSVILVADRNKHTLLDFQFRAKWEAEDGEGGGGRQREGLSGKDLLISLPVGTQVFSASGELVADLHTDAQQIILCKGGRGGKGNEFFKSPTNRAPEHFQPGEPGEEGSFRLSLKLVADVGLVGFPNAGKSTLISRISSAKPKIADYPFTTLTPNLGVVQAKGGRSFVVADVPGLIPGAHLGKGLGIKFLKHIERTKVIAHLIDPTALTEQGEPLPPLDAYHAIREELEKFSEELTIRREIVVITKAELIPDREILNPLIEECKRRSVQFIVISAATGEGIPELIELMAAGLF